MESVSAVAVGDGVRKGEAVEGMAQLVFNAAMDEFPRHLESWDLFTNSSLLLHRSPPSGNGIDSFGGPYLDSTTTRFHAGPAPAGTTSDSFLCAKRCKRG